MRGTILRWSIEARRRDALVNIAHMERLTGLL